MAFRNINAEYTIHVQTYFRLQFNHTDKQRTYVLICVSMCDARIVTRSTSISIVYRLFCTISYQLRHHILRRSFESHVSLCYPLVRSGNPIESNARAESNGMQFLWDFAMHLIRYFI